MVFDHHPIAAPASVIKSCLHKPLDSSDLGRRKQFWLCPFLSQPSLSPKTGLFNRRHHGLVQRLPYLRHGGCKVVKMSLHNSSISKTAAVNSTVASSVTSASTGWLSTLTALAFGAVLVFAVGFAPMDVAHNAAHDTRHSMAFPCH